MPKMPEPQSQIYVLSVPEAVSFGWEETQIVCSIRAPDGSRHIPTRDVLDDGTTWYGYVETMEPPPHYTVVAWLTEYGSWQDVRRGLLC